MICYPYGTYVALGAALTLALMALTAKKMALPRGTVSLFGALGIPMALIFARLMYCLVNNSYLEQLLYFWDGGYSIVGAGIGLTLAALITARLNKGSFGALADSLFSFLWIFVILERLGEAHTLMGLGREIRTEWLSEIPFFAIMDDQGYLCHAVYRYEAVFALIGLIVSLCLMASKKTRAWPKGDLALIAVSLYGCAQAVLESMRDDEHMVLGEYICVNQFTSVLLAAAALIVFTVRGIRRQGKMSWEPAGLWILGAASIGLGLIKEFDIDTSTNLWLDYGVMALAMVLLFTAVAVAHRWARTRRTYSL